MGNASSKNKINQQELSIIDASFTQELANNQLIDVRSEFYSAFFGHDGEPRANQTGTMVSTTIDVTPTWELGLRYSTLGKHEDTDTVKTQWSAMITRQLTETSKFRLQSNSGENTESTILAQFIFGMGPHSHVLN